MKRSKSDTKSESSDRLKDANQKLRSENRELRKELTALKRANKRLRKEFQRIDLDFIDRQEEIDDGMVAEFEPLQVELPEESESTKSLTCSNCGGHNVEEVFAGLYTVDSCPDCGKRRRRKKG